MLVVTLIGFTSAYCTMLPATYFLSYHTSLGYLGLWLGPVIGDSVKLLACVCVMLFTVDWEKEAVNAQERSEVGSLYDDDTDDDEDGELGEKARLLVHPSVVYGANGTGLTRSINGTGLTRSVNGTGLTQSVNGEVSTSKAIKRASAAVV
jgi:hypothetical protein